MDELRAGRLLGLDYGAKTVGIAVSDPSGKLATALEIARRDKENHLRRTFARIEELCVEYGVSGLVVGLPLNMDGSEGEMAKAARAFGQALSKRTGLTVIFNDERLTSAAAEEYMKEAGIPAGKRKERIDAVAAALILQDHLDGRLAKTNETR